MSRKTPTYKELYSIIVKIYNFKLKRTTGSHEHFEGYYNNIRRVVTLDKKHDKLPSLIQKQNVKSIIKQLGISKSDFEKALHLQK